MSGLVGCLIASAWIGGTAAGGAAVESQDWMPGEAIVRFSPSSLPAATLRQALSGALHEEPALVEYLGALSERLGLPVKAKRLTSGGELLMEIDRSALQARLLQQFLEDPGVQEATAVDTSGESPFADPGIEIRAKLDSACDGARVVAAAWAEQAEHSSELETLVLTLAGGLDLPLRGRAAGAAELAIRADLRTLTERLLLRLRDQPEVEAAEPNRMLGIR